ncbi:MAG: hypothetical protein JW806_04670 [Sedimentisphaerales bacterium]|nr:hypothetical protein [Sedimentisphaerales bacterium]
MPISFQCENCAKKITAPDTAGGKWGKCPACHHRCYVPMPKSDDEEELKLAPIDDEEEKKYEQAMQESHSLTGMLLHQTDDSEEVSKDKATSAERELVVEYLRRMASGQLEQAKKTLTQIKSSQGKSKIVLRGMLKSKDPVPELSDIPPKVLTGLISNLLEEIR